MKPLSVIFGIITLVLWLGSATYIAAPDSVTSKLPSPPMGNIPSAFLGVLLFLLSIVVIAVWAVVTKDTPEPQKVPATQ
ncbi:MAG: hypothetical protein OK439_06320 [Thaumarchaeota archaeon]|nr:hypothetical protein [Nitrososphaerota archaeon]